MILQPGLGSQPASGAAGVALVGYSIGATKAVYYQAHRQDHRVRGVAAVSGPTRRHRGVTREFAELAERMVAEGRGRDLMPVEPWGRSFSPPKPGPVSAQTYLSWARSNLDVFGLDASEPAIAAIRCPVFACYGTNEEEIGTPDDLETIRKNARAALAVDTKVFEGATHAYAGHEASLAAALGDWITTLA